MAITRTISVAIRIIAYFAVACGNFSISRMRAIIVALDLIPQCDSTSDSRFSSISGLSGSDGAMVVRSVMASDLLNHSRTHFTIRKIMRSQQLAHTR